MASVTPSEATDPRIEQSNRTDQVQGAFILAKAKGSATVAARRLDHLRRYLEPLFPGRGGARGRTRSR
jgi:hypothetical protein